MCIYNNTDNKGVLGVYPLIWLSGVAYVLMNTIDDRTNNSNYINMLVLTGLGCILLYSVILVFLKEKGKLLLKNIGFFTLGVAVLVILAIMLCHFDRYSNAPVSSILFLNLLFS